MRWEWCLLGGGGVLWLGLLLVFRGFGGEGDGVGWPRRGGHDGGEDFFCTIDDLPH